MTIENTPKATIEVKNEKGEGFELPLLYIMPRTIYKALTKAQDIVVEINVATAEFKAIEKDDEHLREKSEFQLKRISNLKDRYEENFDIIEEQMNEHIPGWKEFSYGLSERAWISVIGKVLGTGVRDPKSLFYNEKLDFTVPQ